MKVNLMIATNADATIEVGTVQCMEYARWNLLTKGITFYWEIMGGTSKAKQRSIVASHFLRNTDAPYLMIIDRDMLFGWDLIYRLYQDLEKGYDLISGIYCLRNGRQLSGYNDTAINIDGGIYECKYIPTGFTGYSRKLLQRMVDELKIPLLEQGEDQEHYPFFEEKVWEDKGKFLGEDWDFCEKAASVGIKAYVDTKLQPGHIGDKIYSLKDYMDDRKESDEFEEKRFIPVLQDIKADLAQYFHVNEEEVTKRISIENCMARENSWWMDNKGTPEDFYRENEAIVFDLAGFNLQKVTQESRYCNLKGMTGKKILDIGCGIGTLSFILAEQGNEVTGFDINNVAISFCKFLNKKYNRNVIFVNELPLDLTKFDVITATDVLEHIKDLKGFLLELSKRMKVGGMLYHYDAFDNVQAMMHFSENGKFRDQWLREVGFDILEEKWAVKV
jgi:2-polyprenyl-3-methyl-5-hydroxy-6-metoxy-1,4-benzoquinol methylase